MFNKVIIVLIVVFSIFAYHSYLVSNMVDDYKANAFTNIITIHLGDTGEVGKMIEVFGAPMIERIVNTHAREHFDIYAMIIPYRVKFE